MSTADSVNVQPSISAPENNFLFTGLQPIIDRMNQSLERNGSLDEAKETEIRKRLIKKRYFDKSDREISVEEKKDGTLQSIQFNKNELLNKRRKRQEDEEVKKNAIISEVLNKFITEINKWDNAPNNHTVKLCTINVVTNARNKVIQKFLDELEHQRFYYVVEFNQARIYIQVYLYEPTLSSFRHHGVLVATNCHNLRMCVNGRSKYS
jgi:hypothetical protein